MVRSIPRTFPEQITHVNNLGAPNKTVSLNIFYRAAGKQAKRVIVGPVNQTRSRLTLLEQQLLKAARDKASDALQHAIQVN